LLLLEAAAAAVADRAISADNIAAYCQLQRCICAFERLFIEREIEKESKRKRKS